MTILSVLLHFLLQAALIARVLLREHRDPASRLAWIVVILAVPIAGMLAYLLLGETNIGRRRVERVERVRAALPAFADIPGVDADAVRPAVPERWLPLFRVGSTISGFAPVAGNAAELMAVANVDGALVGGASLKADDFIGIAGAYAPIG